jgi:hypothetical protein
MTGDPRLEIAGMPPLHVRRRLEWIESPAQTKIFDKWGDGIVGGAPRSTLDLCLDDESSICHCDIVLRCCLIDNARPCVIGGIGGVFTAPELRQRGLAGLILNWAMSILLNETPAVACVLFALDGIAGFYVGLGWHMLNVPVTIAQPNGRIHVPGCMNTLIRPFNRGGADLDVGSRLDIEGLPW